MRATSTRPTRRAPRWGWPRCRPGRGWRSRRWRRAGGRGAAAGQAACLRQERAQERSVREQRRVGHEELPVALEVHELLREQEGAAVEARADGAVLEDAGMQPALRPQAPEPRAPRRARRAGGLRDAALDGAQQGREAHLPERPREERLHDAAHEALELGVAQSELLAQRRPVGTLELRRDVGPRGLVAERGLERAAEEAMRVRVEAADDPPV